MAKSNRIRQPKAPKPLTLFDSIYIKEDNPYGYQININHPLIKPFYDDFLKTTPLPSNEDRYWFEGVITIWYYSDEVQEMIITQDKEKLLDNVNEILSL